jgi:hypothetical protein
MVRALVYQAVTRIKCSSHGFTSTFSPITSYSRWIPDNTSLPRRMYMTAMGELGLWRHLKRLFSFLFHLESNGAKLQMLQVAANFIINRHISFSVRAFLP